MIGPLVPALIFVPLVAGLLAFWWRADGPRRVLLVLTALVHAGLTVDSLGRAGTRSRRPARPSLLPPAPGSPSTPPACSS